MTEPLWTDERIDDLARTILRFSETPRDDAFSIIRIMHREYEAERAALLARIAELEHYVTRLEATLEDNDEVFASHREIEVSLNTRIAELEAAATCPKRVRVTKAAAGFWYAEFVGQTFDVDYLAIDQSGAQWICVRRHDYRIYSNTIRYEDCEPVPDEIAPSAGVPVYDYRDEEENHE